MKILRLAAAFVLLLGLSVLVGCSDSGSANDSPSGDTPPPSSNGAGNSDNVLRVMAFNIQAGRNADGEIDLESMANLIELVDPDIVALQEVDVNTGRSGGIDMVAILAQQTGLEASFGPAMEYDNGYYGNALLSKRKLSQTETIALVEGGEPRSAAKGSITLKDQIEVDVYSTHFDAWEMLARVDSAYQLNALVTDINRPAILAGDLNAEVQSETINVISQLWMLSDPDGAKPTFPASSPTKKIDYIAAYPKDAWKVLSAEVLPYPELSDHRPYVVELEYLD